jgi:F-type H+-transporting ATPase subunit b
MTGAGESIWSWLFKLINFGVLVWILVRYGGKPFKNYLQNRHKGIKEKIDEAERLLKEAEGLKREYEVRLSGLDQEIEAFKKATLEEVEREKEKVIAEAKEYAMKIKEQARLTYEYEAREAREKIREEIGRLVIERAEEIVRKSFTEEDHNRLVDDFIERLRSMN